MRTTIRIHISVLIMASLFLIVTASASLAWTVSGTIYGGSVPLPDTVVTAFDAGDGSEVATSTTDASGLYSLSIADGAYNLLIAPQETSGLANSLVNGLVVSGADVAQNVVLVQSGVTLSGVLSLPDGSPVDGMKVSIYEQTSGTKVGEMTTGIDGGYQFPLAAGTYYIDLYGLYSGLDFVGAPYQLNAQKIFIDITVSEDKVQDFTLPLVWISGQTTDSNGVPVGGVELQISESWSDHSQSPYAYTYIRNIAGHIVSDTDGNYSMAVFAHDYDVTLIPPAGSGLAQTVLPAVPLTVDSNDQTFALNQAKTLSGILSLPDGSPVNGMKVSIYEQTSGTKVGEMTTGIDGGYQFPLAAGTYYIDLYGLYSGLDFVGAPYQLNAQKIFIDITVSEDKVQDFTLPLVWISGQTTDSNGVPVGGVELQISESWSDHSQSPYAYTYIRNIAGHIVSDTDGNYSMAVFAHDYDVTLIPPAGSGLAQTVLPAVPLTVDSNDQTFALNQAKTLSGILSLPDGSPVNGMKVSIYEQTSGTKVGEMTTGIDGGYQFPLAAGTYYIDLYGLYSGLDFVGAPYQLNAQKIFIDITVSEDKVQDFTLPLVWISGQTTDSNGVPVGGVELQISESWSDHFQSPYAYTYIRNIAGHIVSDTDGNYSMAVFAHDYDVTIIPAAGSGFAQTVVNGLTVNQNVLQNIILSMPDTVAPVILSRPTVTSITDTTAVVEWQTDEKASGEVRYGLSDPPSAVVSETATVTIHSQVLTGLTPDTDFFVQVTGIDPAGNGPVESAVVSFHTKPTPDTKAPVIIEGPIVTSIGHDSAVVQWRTDEPSSGTLSFGLTEGLGSAENSNVLATSHQVTLTGLGAQTLHYLQVSSVDGSGNGPSLSPVLSFTTVAAPDMTAPVIIEGPMISEISDTGATVFWTTDEPATSGVSYNDGTAYGVYQDDALVTEHTVKLTGLTASTLYELTISSKDGQSNGPTLNGPNSFSTLATPDTYPPVIIESPLIVNITHQSVVIRWKTDEQANGVIEYGLAADQLTETESRAALTPMHNMPITGLESGTEYFFRVLSTDANGNGPIASDIHSFLTDPDPKNKQPQMTKQPEVIHKDDDQITIAWETDEPTDTVVEYAGPDGEKKRRSDAKKTQKHQVTLVGLQQNTDYDISILSTDGDGNALLAAIGKQPVFLASTGSGGIELPTSVLTDAVPDDTAPRINGDPAVLGVSDTIAVLHWTTDEIADSLVSYGLQGGSLNFQAGHIFDATEHIVVLTNLFPNTSYDFQVASTDTNGNGPTLSSVLSFTTGSTADSSGPTFVSTPEAVLVSEDGAIIEWTSNEAATSSLIFGTDPTALTDQVAVAGVRLDHSLVITGLLPGTDYFYRAVSVDPHANSSASSVLQLTTLGNPPSDSDGDGVLNGDDVFPLDPTESIDTDSDGIGNNADSDDDGDGVADSNDAFPLDTTETVDTDSDSIGNNTDVDDDGDNVADVDDAFPLDATESVDTDSDGIGNNADSDDDGDSVADSSDAFPLDATESVDTDSDGIGNNADSDDDGDGIADSSDAFPLDATESVDTDSDGIGNNADSDDDGDGIADSNDDFPLDATKSIDTDTDGDGVLNGSDAFPLDPSESVDTDSDGIGNNADNDDDGDGVADSNDVFPLDATESVDADNDGIGDSTDNCPIDANPDQVDQNNSGIGDACEDVFAPVVTVSPLGGLFDSSVDVTVTAVDQEDLNPAIYVAINGETAELYTGPITVETETEISVYAVDSGGNRSEELLETYIIDLLSPAVHISALGDGSYTKSQTINIAGIVADNVGVAGLTINAEEVSFDVDGNFSTVLGLTEGTNSITTVVTDLAGHSTEDARIIILDLGLPGIVISAPADNGKIADGTLMVTGTVNEGATVSLTVNDGAPTLASMLDSRFSSTVSLTPGLNTITLTATDLAGNISAEKRTVTFDDQKPSLSVTSPAEDLISFESSLLLRGTVEDALSAVKVSIEFNGETFTPDVIDGNFEQILTFYDDKTYQAHIMATDEAGNSVSTTRNIIYVDRLKGDLNRDDVVDVSDALMALQVAVGQVVPADENLLYGDVAPLVNGNPAPDGTISVGDALVILKKVVGLISY